MRIATSVACTLTIVIIGQSVDAADLGCSDILQFGIFDTSERSDSYYEVMQAQNVICEMEQENFGTGGQSGGGFSLGVDVFDFGLSTYDAHTEFRAWQRDFCSLSVEDLARNQDYRSYARSANEHIVDAWRDCINLEYNAGRDFVHGFFAPAVESGVYTIEFIYNRVFIERDAEIQSVSPALDCDPPLVASFVLEEPGDIFRCRYDQSNKDITAVIRTSLQQFRIEIPADLVLEDALEQSEDCIKWEGTSCVECIIEESIVSSDIEIMNDEALFPVCENMLGPNFYVEFTGAFRIINPGPSGYVIYAAVSGKHFASDDADAPNPDANGWISVDITGQTHPLNDGNGTTEMKLTGCSSTESVGRPRCELRGSVRFVSTH